MASIARKNLFEDIPRFIVAQAGIMFAVSLVTIQVGILNGFTRSTTLMIEHSNADLWVGSEDMLHLEATLPIPLERLVQARNLPEVQRAEALMIRSAIWRGPNGKITPVRFYGLNPNSQVFNIPITQGQLSDLSQPYTFITDSNTLDDLSLKQSGESGSIGPLKATLVGTAEDVQSMATSPSLLTSLETSNALSTAGLSSKVVCTRSPSGNLTCLNTFEADHSNTAPKPPTSGNQPVPQKLSLADSISYVLVQAKPNQDIQQLQRRLEAALPGTKAHTKEEMLRLTREYWQKRTGVGFVLGLGATVGIVVGMVVVSQILYSSVADHIREFGTLKAMGASDWVIYGVITEQALWMAVLGYLPSMALCFGLGAWTLSTQGIMILITPLTAIGVFGLTVVMCVGSALFAIQKVTHVDPAIVFKA